MPKVFSIQAPISRVDRGRNSVTHAFSAAFCASVNWPLLPPPLKSDNPSTPADSKRPYQVRTVSSSSSRNSATSSQLFPRSSSTSAFARRATRCSAVAFRARIVRDRRCSGVRKLPRIMKHIRILHESPRKRRFSPPDGVGV